MNTRTLTTSFVLLAGLFLFNPPAGNAQKRSDANGSSTLKQAMIDLSREMYNLIEKVESVEDVEKIDRDIGKIFDRLVKNLKQAMDEPAALQNMGTTIENDPEVQKWSRKVEEKMSQLKREHPATAAKIEDVVNRHSQKLIALMQEAMADAMQGTDLYGDDEQVDDYAWNDGAESVDPDDLSPVSRSLRDAMIELSSEMYNLIEGITTVKDVEKIDGDIGKIFDDLVENLKGAMDDPAALQNMGTAMENDPEVQEWSRKVEEKMNQLKAEHPAAAAKLEELINRHSEKLMKLMQDAMMKAMQNMDESNYGY